jgi:hypothetical protein
MHIMFELHFESLTVSYADLGTSNDAMRLADGDFADSFQTMHTEPSDQHHVPWLPEKAAGFACVPSGESSILSFVATSLFENLSLIYIPHPYFLSEL